MLPKEHEFSLTTLEEKNALYNAIAQLTNPIIVEVGTYLGGSAAIMATSNPTAKIYTYDLYDGRDNDPLFKEELLEKSLGLGVPRNLETVSNLLSEYTNIFLHRSRFLNTESFNWNGDPIDVYFDDGDHYAPGLNRNLEYWLPKLKKGGLMIFHDHRPHLPLSNPLRWPAVEEAVHRLSTQGYTKVLKAGSLLILKKCC
jgi:predicted O-methyltransferase YrrM